MITSFYRLTVSKNLAIVSNKQEMRKSLNTSDDKQKNKQNLYLIEHCFKGTVVNWAFPSLHRGLLEIKLTVPLNQLNIS